MSDKHDRQREIEKLAYKKWEEAGSPRSGHGGFWVEAEKEYDEAQRAKATEGTTGVADSTSGASTTKAKILRQPH